MRAAKRDNKFATGSREIYRDIANHLGMRDCAGDYNGVANN